MTSGRIEPYRPRSPNDPLNQAAAVWAAAWRAACKHDRIAETAKFVVFSDDNPFVQFVDAAAREMFARIAEYQSGGYVGLTINRGRARSRGSPAQRQPPTPLLQRMGVD
jgi:hypothetical protein